MEEVDFITISMQSMDNEVNSALLNAKNDFDRISALKKVLATDGLREKVTVNLNLVQEGVDAKGKFLAALFMLEDFGCQQLRINEVMQAPHRYVNFEKMMGVELDSPYSHGCKTELSLPTSMRWC